MANTELRAVRSVPLIMVTVAMERLGVTGNVPGNKDDVSINTSMIGNQLIPVLMLSQFLGKVISMEDIANGNTNLPLIVKST